MLRRTVVSALPAAALLAVLATAGLWGCSSTAARKPPGRPPSPQTVTQAEPGGDAHDPHLAALRRQVEVGWARRRDKDRQVEVPLPDAGNWKRVRYRGVEHFVGFRYGDSHHVVALGFVVDMPEGSKIDSQRCLRRFEAWARPQVRSWKVVLEPIGSTGARWQGQELVVRHVDGHVDTLLSRKRFSAVWTAYPAYPDACLVLGVAAQWRGHPELARQVRDRFIEEGFAEMKILTESKAYRH